MQREGLEMDRYEMDISKREGVNRLFIVEATLKKISVMHVIKLGFAPVSFPPG